MAEDLSNTAQSGVCDGLLTSLKECLLKSDCVVNKGHLPSDCLKNHFDELEDSCKHLRVALFNCKRNKLDMRKRFRGNTAASSSSSSHPSPPSPSPVPVPPTTTAPVADVTVDVKVVGSK